MDNATKLAGGLSARSSEMATRVAGLDWTATPLGAIESWPQSLRIAVGICLDSRFPMFVWWGPDHINIYNDAYIPMLGKRHPSALGRKARDSWDDIWGVVGPQAAAVLERGEATWNDRVLLVMERHGYSEETWFTWSYSPIPDGAGGIGGLFCAVTEETPRVVAERERDHLLSQFAADIDYRIRIEERLAAALRSEQQAREEAELASRMKDEFLATLSHELRTPLNAILGWSHIIRSSKSIPKELERGADVIERNARAQATIIEDLLDMSAIISGKARVEMKEVDLAAVVRAAVETARPAADARQVRIMLDSDSLRGDVIRGDANRLQQVMWNLLTNAIKYTPPEGRIQVTLRHEGSRVELLVSDTGEGIAPDFLPHVFERFRQADSSSTRRHGGLGLGLAIVKQLVELHGGEIRAGSLGLGKGSTFTVTLPIAGVRLPSAKETGPLGTHASAPMPVRIEDREAIAGTHLVVVDDEPDARELVRQLLRECGATVSIAASAAEAVTLLSQRRYDVLVSDIGMPHEDGHALMRRIRAQDPGGNGAIPAVALTAYARGEDIAKAMAAGFQLHAPKPLEPAVLISLVASLARIRTHLSGEASRA